jgi:hypothetical protein
MRFELVSNAQEPCAGTQVDLERLRVDVSANQRRWAGKLTQHFGLRPEGGALGCA